MDQIKQMIVDGKVREALFMLDEYIQEKPSDDNAYYLRGNAYRKLGDVRQAMNNYLMAISLNPDSPAVVAQEQLTAIMNFYNKDMFNQ